MEAGLQEVRDFCARYESLLVNAVDDGNGTLGGQVFDTSLLQTALRDCATRLSNAITKFSLGFRTSESSCYVLIPDILKYLRATDELVRSVPLFVGKTVLEELDDRVGTLMRQMNGLCQSFLLVSEERKLHHQVQCDESDVDIAALVRGIRNCFVIEEGLEPKDYMSRVGLVWGSCSALAECSLSSLQITCDKMRSLHAIIDDVQCQLTDVIQTSESLDEQQEDEEDEFFNDNPLSAGEIPLVKSVTKFIDRTETCAAYLIDNVDWSSKSINLEAIPVFELVIQKVDELLILIDDLGDACCSPPLNMEECTKYARQFCEMICDVVDLVSEGTSYQKPSKSLDTDKQKDKVLQSFNLVQDHISGR